MPNRAPARTCDGVWPSSSFSFLLLMGCPSNKSSTIRLRTCIHPFSIYFRIIPSNTKLYSLRKQLQNTCRDHKLKFELHCNGSSTFKFLLIWSLKFKKCRSLQIFYFVINRFWIFNFLCMEIDNCFGF